MKPCKLPPFLKRGSRIALIATARSVQPDEISAAIATLESAGFEVVQGKNLHAVHHPFAGNDEERASDLQWALDNERIDAIICARGGFGTLRLVDQLDFTRFLKKPKWLVGYSDITVLHSVINSKGICTLHGTMPINFEKHEPSTQQLLDYLTGTFSPVEWESNSNTNFSSEGILCGGNLSLIYALQGSGDLFIPENGIVFLEDLDEYYYHIDRMVLSLKRSAYFKNAKAILLGGFDGMKDHATPFGQNEEEILNYHLNEKIPVITSFPAGHGLINMPLVMGAKYRLDVK
ncbi:MAG: LD-carboxypeptidase, partial [Flavobacteriales bacterium]